MVPLGNCRFLRAVGGFALSSPPACLFRCAASKAAAAPSFVAGCVELCRKDGWHDCDCSGPPLNRAIDVQRCSFIVTRGHEGARGRVGGAGGSALRIRHAVSGTYTDSAATRSFWRTSRTMKVASMHILRAQNAMPGTDMGA
eukprot:1714688-Rhodomonas_salina.5